MPDREIIDTISNYYVLQILKEYNNNMQSVKAIEIIAKSLKDIYRYFEPGFFEGELFVYKHFNDTIILNEKTSTFIYDKNILLNKTSGKIIIQVLSDGKLYLWENETLDPIIEKADILVYNYQGNREYFFANKGKIEITAYPKGSRYATQYMDLMNALNSYKNMKVLQSSCRTFNEVWHDNNRLFFKSEGAGKNIPEKYMQESLNDYLHSNLFVRGISTEVNREFNVNEEKPKPVDIRVHWKEANRIALIEIKWLGVVKTSKGTSYKHDNPRANNGIVQLKDYHDSALTDMPTSIIKSYLVVIDGRRNNLKEDMVEISYKDGMHYKDVELEIDEDKRYFESMPYFEKPIRMFAAPVCTK